jgi:hypothetical protein
MTVLRICTPRNNVLNRVAPGSRRCTFRRRDFELSRGAFRPRAASVAFGTRFAQHATETYDRKSQLVGLVRWPPHRESSVVNKAQAGE